MVLEERLDLVLITASWLQLLPHARSRNLFSFVSDHTRILLGLYLSQKALFRRSFRFKNKWLLEPDIDSVVTTSWDNSAVDNLILKLDVVIERLNECGKQLAHKFRKSIDDCKNEMEDPSDQK